MIFQPEISACSIKLIGQFNPAIFHPAWLHSKRIEQINSEFAGDFITLREFAQFSIENRSYLVQTDRFQLATSTAPWVKILDITTKIFHEHLYHTPITAFGINHEVHFRLSSWAARVRLGRTLAPVDPWGKFGQDMDVEQRNLTGGLQSLTMKRKSIVHGSRFETNVTIEPSSKISDGTGVYMRVNAHHSIEGVSDGYGSEEAMSLLAERFEPTLEESETIFNTIMVEGKKQ